MTRKTTYTPRAAVYVTPKQLEADTAEEHQLVKELHACFELNCNVLRLSLEQLRRMAAVTKESK